MRFSWLFLIAGISFMFLYKETGGNEIMVLFAPFLISAGVMLELISMRAINYNATRRFGYICIFLAVFFSQELSETYAMVIFMGIYVAFIIAGVSILDAIREKRDKLRKGMRTGNIFNKEAF